MQHKSLVLKDYFFDVIKQFENFTPPVSVKEFCEASGVTEKQLEETLSQLKGHNLHFHLQDNPEGKYLFYPENYHELKMTFHLPEIFSLYQMRQNTESPFEKDSYEGKILDEKLKGFMSLLHSKPKNRAPSKNWPHQIEQAIHSESVIDVSLSSGKHSELFPHRLIHLDGDLHLVCEECWDKCLVYLPVSIIESVEMSETLYEKNFSKKEVEDFVSALGHLSDQTERVVLKIYDQELVDSPPLKDIDHYVTERPFVTTNAQGELIWAANVVVNEELYEWLYQIREQIEILDPQNFLTHYHEYLEKTGRGHLQKKAS